MLPDLTPAVARALEAAGPYARAAGSEVVRPIDLLSALLEEEEGRAAVLAVAAGLEDDRRRATLPRRDAANRVALSRAPHTEAILARASELALDLTGERTVAGDSLLLALLREDSTSRTALEALGLDFARLEASVLAQRTPTPTLEEPLHLEDATERIDAARVLDACANRAREGLRVVEDYCRFVLDDAFLSGALKELRHDLSAALSELASEGLLEARETQRDVGTDLATDAERHRTSLLGVLQANWKRLQEALRSLEEFGKVFSPRLGQVLEQVRYRSYTLERALVLGTNARERLKDARLYVLLSSAQCAAALDWTIAEAAAGGADLIQLREKGMSDRELLERARLVRRWTRQAGVLFIVNDRPDVARLVEADGVHLGQDDVPVKEARRIVGPDALIGVSTHDLGQLRQAILDGASYIGVGPTFPSGTKEFAELAGLAFVREAMLETTLPAFVIGGVNLETIGQAVSAGARRVAVSQVVATADDPRRVALTLRQALTSAG
jgi:thiamine-phosphate pyrophosphorylase